MYDRDSPSGSELAAAVRVTVAPSVGVWSDPAFAVGPSLSAETVIITVSVDAVVPSVTETWNVDVYCASPSTAVNVGAATLVAERVWLVPAVCDHVYDRV